MTKETNLSTSSSLERKRDRETERERERDRAIYIEIEELILHGILRNHFSLHLGQEIGRIEGTIII